MKTLLFTLVFIASSYSFSQYSQIRFKEATFENGMLYPVVISPGLPEVSDLINNDLQKNISDLKDSDFCIGQYGYVQKADIIQIHIFCNCIDFNESQNRYFLYNVDNGKAVDNMSIIDEKKVKKFTDYILAKTKEFAIKNNIDLSPEDLGNIKSNQLKSFKMILSKDGINLSLNDQWGGNQLFVSWIDLKPFMRYS